MDYIEVKQRKDILKLGIKDEEGNVVLDENGKEIFIEFDLGDIDLPLNYNRCVEGVKNAQAKLKNQLIIINKKQDHKTKGFLTANEEAKVKAMKQFYKETEEAMDLFLGKGGTKKYLNGRKPYWEMWDDINESLKPHLSKMKLTVDDMTERIKEKYKVAESDVLTSD